MELCGLWGSCGGSVFTGYYGNYCTRISVRCELGCRDQPAAINVDASNVQDAASAAQYATEAYCISPSDGEGGAGGGDNDGGEGGGLVGEAGALARP